MTKHLEVLLTPFLKASTGQFLLMAKQVPAIQTERSENSYIGRVSFF